MDIWQQFHIHVLYCKVLETTCTSFPLVNFRQIDYSSLFATIRHYSSLFATIRHYSQLSVTIRHYSSLFVTICHYSRLFVLFATICYSLFWFSRHLNKLAKCNLGKVKLKAMQLVDSLLALLKQRGCPRDLVRLAFDSCLQLHFTMTDLCGSFAIMFLQITVDLHSCCVINH